MLDVKLVIMQMNPTDATIKDMYRALEDYYSVINFEVNKVERASKSEADTLKVMSETFNNVKGTLKEQLGNMKLGNRLTEFNVITNDEIMKGKF